MLNSALLTAISLSLMSVISCGTCPPAEIMYPCSCGSQEITCGGTAKINLKGIFQQISANLKDSEKHFQFFTFNNTAEEEIEDNAFGDITFIAVEFVDAVSLRRLSPNAFSPANTRTITTFHQHGVSKLGDDNQSMLDTFAALSSLVKVNEMLFEINRFPAIPARAFANSEQTGLKTLLFNNDYSEKHTALMIGSINDYAFYYLNTLSKLYLWHQRIDTITEHAFDFYQTSDNTLSVDLRYNMIDDRSIKMGAFTKANRPLTINLANNKLTFFNETIFAPILSANKKNFINATGIEFDCGQCANKWLISKKLNNQIEFGCKNGKSFWTLSDADFAKC